MKLWWNFESQGLTHHKENWNWKPKLKTDTETETENWHWNWKLTLKPKFKLKILIYKVCILFATQWFDPKRVTAVTFLGGLAMKDAVGLFLAWWKLRPWPNAAEWCSGLVFSLVKATTLAQCGWMPEWMTGYKLLNGKKETQNKSISIIIMK